MSRIEHVVLVDHNDRAIGSAEKLLAHRHALLHRAFSVFIFDGHGRLMLQRRAASKYHSGGLWSNTVCSHPRPGETPAHGAVRRLDEEMGFLCRLEPAFAFTYRVDLGNGLHEHEYDHVFTGRFHGAPRPDPTEVDGWRMASPEDVRHELAGEPERFTYWFRIAFEQFERRGLMPSVSDRVREIARA